VGALVAISMIGMVAVIITALFWQWRWALTLFLVTVGVIAIIVRKRISLRKFINQK
jgi:membrane protein implicated in regulation of membrane protease activity